MTKIRADVLLIARGVAATRAQAQAAIEAGLARADGAVIRKASHMLRENVTLECAPAHPWVSRGGMKLARALDEFSIDPNGLVCLDVGASTGGFTDVLLTRGARRVYAVDVGRGQLAEKLRADARVVSLEETDARALTRDHVTDPVDLIVADVSFIGLVKALPVALKLAAPRAALIALVKPQFESGPRKRETVDAEEARAIAEKTAASLDGLEGFQRLGLIESPIEGGAGALEFLYAGRRP